MIAIVEVSVTSCDGVTATVTVPAADYAGVRCSSKGVEFLGVGGRVFASTGMTGAVEVLTRRGWFDPKTGETSHD